jgi:hypothetical protein
MQLVNVGLLSELAIPPPLSTTAEFPVNVQFISIGLLSWLNIAPPPPAEFPLNVQLATVELLFMVLTIPPPLRPVFQLKMQLETVGVLSTF